MKRFYTIIILLFTLFLSHGRVDALEVEIETSDERGLIKQGDIILVKVKSSTDLSVLTGELEGRSIFFERKNGREFNALVGFDVDQKVKDYEVYLLGKSGEELVQHIFSFDLLARDYKVERLKLPKNMVVYDEMTLKRIKREGKSLNKLRTSKNDRRLWRGNFDLPVDGKVTYNFGARRILNGVKKKPHSGVDIKAYKGRKIKSPNSGKVSLVDNHYFGGKVVVIDHGHNLSTIYMHLSKILVNHGEEVDRGELIGLVGSTGRSTGPHLHWSAYLNGAKVDPTGLLSLPFNDLLVVADKDEEPAIENSDDRGSDISVESLGGI